MMRLIKTIPFAVIFFCAFSASANVVLQEAAKSSPINADLFGVNHAALKTDSSPPGGDDPLAGQVGSLKIALDKLMAPHPTGLRYPPGEAANYWDGANGMMCESLTGGSDCVSVPWVVKRKVSAADNDSHPYATDSLTDKVTYAIANNVTITFVCNMVTPGADYYANTSFPVRSGDAPIHGYSESALESDYWYQMKQRAFTCVDMIKVARDMGLDEDKIKVELGNELYLGKPYNVEAFPPDFSENSDWDYFINRLPVGAARIAADAVKVAIEAHGLNDILRESDINAAEISAGRTNKLDQICAGMTDLECVAEHMPPDDDYAYAAVYFADLIKNLKNSDYGGSGDEKYLGDTSKIKIAVVGGINSNYSEVVNKRRFQWWDAILMRKIKDLDEDGLITAIARHPYFFYNGWSYQDIWGADKDSGESDLDDPAKIGEMARGVYKEAVVHATNSNSCAPGADYRTEIKPIASWLQPGCLGLFKEIWNTEWDIAHLDAAISTEVDDIPIPSNRIMVGYPDQTCPAVPLNVFPNMWAKALGAAYMSLKTMEQDKLTTAHFFFMNDMLQNYMCSGSAADFSNFTYRNYTNTTDRSMGQVLALLAEATQGTNAKTELLFSGAPVLPSSSAVKAGVYEKAAALPSVYGWKFSSISTAPFVSSNNRYLLLNLGADPVNVDLSAITGDKTVVELLQSACSGPEPGLSRATCQNASSSDDPLPITGDVYEEMPGMSLALITTDEDSQSLSDADSDGVPDALDNCTAADNADQTDTNGNGIGDVCEDLDGDQILDFEGGVRVDGLYYLDENFGDNDSGKVETDFQSGMDSRIFSLAQQSDGKLVATGFALINHGKDEGDCDGDHDNDCDYDNDYDFAVSRYNTNGSLDSGFDTDGLGTDAIADDGKRTDGPRASQAPWYLNDVAHAVAVQSDGKILVAGLSDQLAAGGSPSTYFGIMRYDANGTLDAFFGSGGKVVQSVEDFSGANAMQIQPDDKILLAGYSSNGSASSFALLRYLEDGTLDDSFNVTGVVTTPIATDAFAHANAMALQNNGDILLAGYVQEVGENKKIALVRYKGADGALDTSFGAGGLVITPVGSTNSAANAVALQHDGGILVAGYSDGVNSNLDALLLRYNIDGSPDTSFGVDGMFISDASGYIDVASAVAVQADGKIWLAGRGGAYKKTLDFFVQRLNADGSLDGTFNSGAPLTVISNPDDGSCSETNPSASLLIQSDGNLAIGALSRDLSSCVSSFSIARVEIPDADGDNFRDTVDAFPANPSASVDSDGDGKPDGCNGSCAGLVLDLDDDNDGLSDAEENIIDTDPVSADSDHDGLNDGYEVNITNTDPLVQTTSAGLCNNASCTADTDGDGFTDGREYTLGTNLLNDLDPPLSAVSDEWVVLISDPFFSTPLEDWLTAQGDLWNSEGQLVVTYSIPRPANVAANNGVYCSAGITGVWCNNEWAGMLQLPSGYQLDEENNYLLAENSTPITDAFKIQISASHGCVLSQTLGLKCWGITGDEVANEAYIPSGVKDFALLGDSMACAALNNGKIKCWGGYATDGYEWPDFEHVIALAAGLAHICAIESDGTTSHVRCVASEGNAYNQLGTDSDTDGYVDVATNPLAITAGSNHTCILSGDYSAPASRSVICWGANDRYQSQVPGLTNPISVQAGGDRTCAVQIGQSDALKCWPIAVGDGTAPPDSDGDSLSDYSEVTGSVVTNPLEEDTDSDTVHDDSDKFPANNSASVDTDNDDQPDSCIGSCTGGLVLDAFPTNASASIDTDNDGQPDSCSGSCTGGLVLDTDDDNDTVLDVNDANPLIGIGSCADADQDGAPDGATCGGMAADSDGYTIYGDNAANSLVRSVAAPSLGYYTIKGWDGDDAIGGWTSNDTLNGGNGTDTVSYVNAATQVTVNLATGTTSGAGGADTLVSIENIIGSNSSIGDTLTGNDNANVINGGLGSDSMYGGKGNDTYYANVATDSVPTWATPSELMGEDTAANGGGVDTVIFSSTTASKFTLAANVENITLTGSAALNAVGNASANVMDSSGNTAANTLTGGVGDDTYIVSSGDTIAETNTTIDGIDTVVVAFTATLNNANLENLTLTGSANLNATGNASDNVITGNAGNNTLNGAAGADTMLGGAGNDIYTVDNANDVVTELASEGTDLVNSSVTYTILDADVENLTLSGASAINATGNTSANILVGNSGANTLSGGVGNDILIGGADADVLTGDADADQFVLDTPATSDTVTDFIKDTDKLVVDMSSIGCGNNDTSIDTPLVNSTAGGFSGSAGVNELVIFTTNTEDTTATTAAAVIGSATSAMAAGRKKIFVVDNGTNSRVYRFTSAANNATVTAAELTLIATLNNVNDSGTGDYLFRP